MQIKNVQDLTSPQPSPKERGQSPKTKRVLPDSQIFSLTFENVYNI